MDTEIRRSDDEHRQEMANELGRRGRWILPALLGGVALAVVIGFSVLPVYRWLKERRGEALAEQAREAIKNQDYEVALSKIKNAVGLAPKSIDVARVTAELCDLYGVPEALGYWQIVVSSTGATRRDRQRFVASALDNGRGDLAQTELADLIKADESDIENLRLSIRFLQQRGDIDGAVFTARRSIELHPTNDAPRLALASLLAGIPVEEAKMEARTILWNLGTKPGPARLEALQILSDDKALTPAEKQKVAASLSEFASERVDARLGALKLKMELEPASKTNLLREAARLIPDRTNSVEITVILQWLHQHDAHNELIAALPFDRARTNSAWLYWYLSSLGGSGRWPELSQHLADKTLELQPYRKFGLLAAAAHAQGDLEAARNYLDNAVGAARGMPEEQRRIAQMAEKMGDWNSAMAAWVQLLDFPPLARGAAQQVLRLSQAGDKPEFVVLAAKRLLSFSPDDVLALNELAYTLLIEGRRDAPTEAALIREANKPNAQPGLQITLALLYLQDNRPQQALDVLEGRGLKLDPAPARWTLVYAAVLSANQQRESAKRVRTGLALEKMKAAEQEFAARWF